jgi:sulfur carrier protein ThiS
MMPPASDRTADENGGMSASHPIKVGLKLYGNLRRYAGGRREFSEQALAPGSTVHDLLTHLGIAEQDWWMVAVNDHVTGVLAALEDGDLVEIFEPVGGGSYPRMIPYSTFGRSR